MTKLLKYLADCPRSLKALFLVLLDTFILTFSTLLAFAVRFEPYSLLYQINIFSLGIKILIIVQVLTFFAGGLYRSVLRHASSELLGLLLRSILLGTGIFAILNFLLEKLIIPRSVLVMSVTFSFLGLLSIRLMIRWVIRLNLVEPNQQKIFHRVAIYGAGSAGLQLFDSLSQEGNYQISAFVDDDTKLQGGMIREKPILSFEELKKFHQAKPLDSVLLAIPRLKHEQRKLILQKIRFLKVRVRILPTTDQLLKGTANVSQLQEPDINDLLGRNEIKPYQELLHQDIKGRNILVTGAGGSIGSELCQEIIKGLPKKLILLELNEFSLYKLESSFKNLTSIPIFSRLGSVNNAELVKNLLNEFKIQTVYHAAAYKHVPLVEENPLEGLRNNILGTKTLIEICLESNVNSFVLISTDKAVRPTSIMGVSKRIAEMIVQDISRNFSEKKIGIVRFGNVLDSSGSVVPLFREQIKNRQAITVTHPEIKRYFMSIGEAARLVIQAGAMSKAGEVFLLDMGESVKIADLAKQMIELSGLIPEKDIPLKFTGLRPGEKLFEELLIEPSKSKPTIHDRIFFSIEPVTESKVFKKEMSLLTNAINGNDLQSALECIKKLVPEYNQKII